MVEHRLFEYEPNKPIGFFLHSSIRSKFQQQNLRSKIIVCDIFLVTGSDGNFSPSGVRGKSA
jgi:hypothetical protein